MTGDDEFAILESEVLLALAEHQRWRETVRHAPDVRAVAAMVAPIESCELSAWLRDRMPARFRALPLYERTARYHRDFHAAMAMVAWQELEGRPLLVRAARDLKSALDEWLTIARAGERDGG